MNAIRSTVATGLSKRATAALKLAGGSALLLGLIYSLSPNATRAKPPTAADDKPKSSQPVASRQSAAQADVPEDSRSDEVEPAQRMPATQRETPFSIERAFPAVALVRTTGGSGTGFMVSRNVLATNHHVAGSSLASEIQISFAEAPKGQQAYRV